MNDPRHGSLYRCWISTDGITSTVKNQYYVYVAGECHD